MKLVSSSKEKYDRSKPVTNRYYSGEKKEMIQLPANNIEKIVTIALEEDTGRGDVTSEAIIPCDLQGRAYMLIKEEGILAGIPVVERTFHQVDPSLEVKIQIQDGSAVRPGDIPMIITGNMREHTQSRGVALNFIQRLSGIATTTSQYVEKVRDLGVEIADTRKTTPGLRILEKYAVRVGGGRNHRMI